jgi:hypothetical protein
MTDLNQLTTPSTNTELPYDPSTLSSPSDAPTGTPIPLEQFDKQFGKLIGALSPSLSP